MLLSELPRGRRALVSGLLAQDGNVIGERLRALGIEEGCQIAMLHAGPLGGDPVMVQVDEISLALRRAEAAQIEVGIEAE